MQGTKVLFTKSVDVIPVRKGIFKDPMLDITGFKLLVHPDKVDKAKKPYKRRKWGDDEEYDSVMRNFGLYGEDGEDIESQIVFGYANVAIQEDGTVPFDWDGDVIPPEVLEAAAYNYVLNSGMLNQEHRWGTDCGWLVESMMFTKAKMEALGIPEGTIPEAWFVGFYIPDPDVYKKVKSGEYNMFSIQGSARRVPLDALD